MRLAACLEPDLWAERVQRGLVRVSAVRLLEVGYSARSAQDLRRQRQAGLLAAMPVEASTVRAEDRALAVQQLLAVRGERRAPSIPDLLLAALAETAGLTVLHVDKDFELIGTVTDQPVERLALRV